MMDAHQETWHMTDVAVKCNGERIRLSVNDGGTVGSCMEKNHTSTSQHTQR